MTVEEHIARAIAAEYWRLAERPRPWDAHSHLHKQVWLDCARAAIKAGREYREAKNAREAA